MNQNEELLVVERSSPEEKRERGDKISAAYQAKSPEEKKERGD